MAAFTPRSSASALRTASASGAFFLFLRPKSGAEENSARYGAAGGAAWAEAGGRYAGCQVGTCDGSVFLLIFVSTPFTRREVTQQHPITDC